jgi:hypothetical protein
MTADDRRSVDAVALILDARDFVLHLQLATLEFSEFQVIDPVMLLSLCDLVIEGLMLLFERGKIRLDGHRGYLLVSDFGLTWKLCHERRHKSAMIVCAVQQFSLFNTQTPCDRLGLPHGPW